jgi:hypothetical protein
VCDAPKEEGAEMTKLTIALSGIVVAAAACMPASNGDDGLRAVIGSEGGQLIGLPGTAFAGVRLQIPPGALDGPTTISITKPGVTAPLPPAAVRCGPMFALQPAGLLLKVPAPLTLPFDEITVNDNDRFEDEVKVWAAQGSGWTQRLQTDNGAGTVTVELQALTTVAAGVNPPREDEKVRFELTANPAFVKCLARYPEDRDQQPVVEVTVVDGEQNDALFLRGRNIKPGLGFDMFTVERTSLRSDGSPDPAIKTFGLAWYQSDLATSDRGRLRASIRTILLNETFGFDADENLAARQVLNLGFWFDDPEDAADCGFDVTKPTPFNPKGKAGPMAMISLPDATTGLGPLCDTPDTTVTPARCSVEED